MKQKTTVVILALCFAFGAVCFADPQMGTWKLNEAKSKLDPEMGKNSTVIYEAAGDNIKVTVDGPMRKVNPPTTSGSVSSTAKTTQSTGDPNSDMRSYTQVNNRILDLTVKKDGKRHVDRQDRRLS